MVRIAYLLLAHRDADAVVAQAACLAAQGDGVVVHFDARAPRADQARLRHGLAGRAGIAILDSPRRCGWGEWSLVAATLDALRTGLDAFPDATHFYLLSADCLPIRPAGAIRRALAARDADWIETEDFLGSDWIRTGLREERLIYRHPFNERRRPRLFRATLGLQRALRLRRDLPEGLRIRIGSQWWCLRRSTAQAVLGFCATRPEVPRFFRTTWIPDETFFQTLVRHLVPASEVTGRAPTFRLFTDYGMPVTFHDDHHDLLIRQDAFFARKIGPGAIALQARLRARFACENMDAEAEPEATPGRAGQGERLYAYLAGRGRDGRRAAPSYWDAARARGAGRTLLILACKKWHVGRRLAARLSDLAGTGAGYAFDEPQDGLPRPDATGPAGRRALIDMLFAISAGAADGGADGTSDGPEAARRLHLCLDPARRDVAADIAPAAAATRLLEIECSLDDDYIDGHAARLGLSGPEMPLSGRAPLRAHLRVDIAHEAQALRDLTGLRHHRISEAAPAQENALSLARFLDISVAEAAPLLADGLFDD